MTAEAPQPTPLDHQEPDPKALWRWVGAALRPWTGWILMGAGALLMLLGWFGVSREVLPAKQIPYLVSGGIGGIFLAVLGAYFLGTQELRNDSGRLDRLEQMVEELHQALLRRADAPAPVSANGTGTAPTRVLVVDGGELFHLSGCAMVEGKDAADLAPSTARRRGLRPCPACNPVPAGASA